jgi:3-hydroxyacyl-[acyl-carrier-protein] dehydratase
MFMNKEQVKAYIPHREPFLFIDTVSSIQLPDEVLSLETVTSKDLVGTKVIANFEVRDDLAILQGHFPGNPILPGVIQVEMIAQAAAFSSLGLNKLKIDEGLRVDTLLLGVESSRFRKPITPGMKLEIHSVLSKCRGQVAVYTGEIYSNQEKISEAQFIAKLVVTRD